MILVDAMFLAYKSRYKLDFLVSSKAGPTGMEYGFLKALESLEKRFKEVPILCWDSRSSRHDVYDGYKKDRGARIDYDRVNKFIDFCKLCYPWCKQEGEEADDLIAGLVDRGEETIIVTRDKDMLQLCNDKVRCLYSWKTEPLWHDADFVWKKYGVVPREMPMFQALAGDAVDSVPGCGVNKSNLAYAIHHWKIPFWENPIFSESESLKLEDFFADGSYWRNLSLVILKRPKVDVVEPTNDNEKMKEWFEYMEIYSLALCVKCGWMSPPEF